MAQKDLFGYTPPLPPKLLLHEPDSTRWKEMAAYLDSHSTKVDLLNYAEALTAWLGKYNVYRAADDSKPVKATEIIDITKSSNSKATIAHGLALVLADQQNMQSYVETLDEEMKNLWVSMLLNIYLTADNAKQILHDESIIVEERVYYYSRAIAKLKKPELKWFSLTHFLSTENSRYRNYENYIAVSQAIHSIFFPIFFPRAFDESENLSQLPDGHWRIVNVEADSHANFQLFLSMMKQDALPVKKKGIGVTDMKRAQKKMSLEEFFPGDTNEYRQHLRAFSYLQLLALHEHILARKKKRSYQDTLRNLFANFNSLDSFLSNILFPHITGLNRQFTEYGKESKLCNMLFTWMGEDPEGWVNLHDVIIRIYALNYGNDTSQHIPLVYNPKMEDYSTHLTNQYSGRVISADSYVMEFGYTGLQMCALLMASVGMAEVAIDEDKNCGVSPFESVAYIRLTPLGRYALGIDTSYEAPKMEQTAYFELDPDRLIIRSLVEPNPYAQLLKDTSIPISRNRFETSALSFLANCHSKSDVESKISIFKQFIADKLPPLWKEFFKTLLQHCHPLQEDSTAYRHYTIDPENRELQQLITNDPVLRQLVIRAEGYRILVKLDDIRKFENQLKKHGYLL